jgi:hypothetical protein
MREIHADVHQRISRSYPQNSPSFPFDRATYPAPFSFASQSVLLAVIFRIDSAPDTPDEHQNEVFPKH